MKIIFNILVVFTSIVMNPGYAQGIAENLLVHQVRVDKSGLGYVGFVSPLTGTPPTCASTHPNQLSFDTNTAGGKSILSMALSAKMSGKRIYAAGTNTCNDYASVESWNSGYLKD